MPAPISALPPTAMSDLIPEIHLAALTGLANPRIVIVGDSISTRGPGVTHDMIDSFWGYFQRAFLLANPGLEPDFRNRAIGRTRFSHLAKAQLKDTLAVAHSYSWADNPDAYWMDEVEALEPDLLIQAFGMNDAGNFDTAGFQKLQQRIDGWSKQPSRIFVTTMLPSRQTDRPPMSSPEGQFGRMYVAHYIRSWACFHGFGLLDLNRSFCQAVRGFDPRVSELTAAPPVADETPSSPPPKASQDFGVKLSGPALLQDLQAGLVFQIGAGKPKNGGIARLRIGLDETGRLVMRFYDLTGSKTPYLEKRSAEPVPPSADTLSVFVKDVFAHVEVNGETAFFGVIRRHGSPFRPKVARMDGAASDLSKQVFFGTFRPHPSFLSDKDAFGAGPVKVRQTGGNAKNHPTSKLAAHVFASLLDGTRLTVPRG